MESDLRLYLFGIPRLEYGGNPIKFNRRKALALLAYLALNERQQSRESLVDVLWPNLAGDNGRSSLRSTLHTLTTGLPDGLINANRTTVALKVNRLWVDVQVFIELLRTTRAHGHDPEIICDNCLDDYQQAIALYKADFMDGFNVADSLRYEDWQATQREWFSRELAHLHRRLSEYHSQMRQYEQAIQHARAWLHMDPLNEPAHRQLIRIYALSGQRTEAMRQYQRCMKILDEELVTPPDDETTRLYEAILSNSLSIVSQNEQPPEPLTASNVLPALPSLTIGREEVIHDLKHRIGIGSGEMRSITVIQGWPGVGKSTTVATLAHDAEVAQQFPDGMLWVSLGENPGLSTSIAAWAEALGISEIDRARRPEEVSSQLIAMLRDRRVLLIVDDVWQIQHAQPFRVGGQRCSLIMTSRLNDIASALAPTAGDIYRLPVLSEEAALSLLNKLAPEIVADYPAESRELVRDLEGLPLAIQVAGRLLHSEAQLGWGVRELLNELETGAVVLQAQAPSDMLGVANDTSPTVAALLKRSTDLLDVETRQRFAYLGLFVPKPATFDLEAMAVVWDVADPRPIARILVNRGLLEPISGGRFQMHALLALHAQSIQREEGLAL